MSDLQQLMGAFRFTDDDLAANRYGQLGPSQERLIGRGQAALRIGRMIGPVLLTIGFGVVFVVMQQQGLPPADLPFYAAILGGAWLLVMGILLVSGRRSAAKLAVLYEVLAVSGSVTLETRLVRNYYDSGMVDAHFATLGDIEFGLTGDQYDHLDEGQYYTAYYIVSFETPVILSIEPA